MSTNVDTIRELTEQEYKWGFVTAIEEDRVPPKGLNEETIRLIFRQKRRAGVHAPVAAESAEPLGLAGAGQR